MARLENSTRDARRGALSGDLMAPAMGTVVVVAGYGCFLESMEVDVAVVPARMRSIEVSVTSTSMAS